MRSSSDMERQCPFRNRMSHFAACVDVSPARQRIGIVAGTCVRVDAPNLPLALLPAPEQQGRCECAQEGKNVACRAIDGPREAHREAGFPGGGADDPLPPAFRLLSFT